MRQHIKFPTIQRIECLSGDLVGCDQGEAGHGGTGKLSALFRQFAIIDDVGGYHGRTQCCDVYASASQLGGQCFRQRKYTCFGDVVGAHLRRSAKRGGGSDINDAAIAEIPQFRRKEMAAVNDTPQVDVHTPVPVFQRYLADGAAQTHARIVNYQCHRTA